MTANADLYAQDFFQWTQTTAALIRAGKWQEIDPTSVAEEIESLGNEQRHALRSHLRILLLHQLKWAYQPRHHSGSWRSSIGHARAEIEDRLADSPSLRQMLPALLTWAYQRARRLAAIETGLPLVTFPETCPWTLDQLQDQEFLPAVGKDKTA